MVCIFHSKRKLWNREKNMLKHPIKKNEWWTKLSFQIAGLADEQGKAFNATGMYHFWLFYANPASIMHTRRNSVDYGLLSSDTM